MKKCSILLLAIAAFLLFLGLPDHFSSNEPSNSSMAYAEVKDTDGEADERATNEKPLKRGDKSETIKKLQRALYEYGFSREKADGVFGPKTEQAVKEVQRYLYEIEHYAIEDMNKSSFEALTLEQVSPHEDAVRTAEEKNDDETADPTQPESDFIEDGERTDGDQETNDPEQASSGDPPILYDGAGDADEPEDDTISKEYTPDGVADASLQALLLEGGFQVYRQDLRLGTYGTEIRRMQTRLSALGYLEGVIDGVFADNTRSAVLSFQKRNKLPQSGVADQQTQYTLYSPEAKLTDKPVYPYYLKVSIPDQKTYAYRFSDGQYSELMRTMVCSTGMDDFPTPEGSFPSGGPVARWCYFPRYECWTQYAFRIEGSILFHSVLFSEAHEKTLRESSVTSLGSKASHGCIRLSVEDAKWIYDNCREGTTVEIY